MSKTRMHPAVSAVVLAMLAAVAPIASQAKGETLLTIPGSVAIQTAQRHGWGFRVRNTAVGGGGNCLAQGHRFIAEPGAYCWIDWFVPPRADCATLRSGWQLHELRISGTAAVDWHSKPQRNANPQARLAIDARRLNQAVEATLDSVVLSRSTGDDRVDSAFNHCR